MAMTAAPWQNRIVGHADVPPADLLPNPRNWRTHPAEQQRALTGALGEVGWVAEVLVNRTTGHVVDGHLRIELALDRNEPTVPVTFVELTEDEERIVLATLDPLAAMADAEAASLAELLAGLEPADEALRALLDDLAREHGLDALRNGLVDPDDVPPVPDEADVYVKPGELMRRRLEGDGTGSRRRKGHRNTTVSGDTRADWSEAFALVPSLTFGYVWHASAHSAEVAVGLARIGFEHVAQVIWEKTLFAMGRSGITGQHEPCWVVRRVGAKVPFLGDRDQSTVWRAASPKMIMANSDEEKLDHPTQKPVLLFETPIRNHLRPGGAVYDPFVGSGTAIVAAETLGRRCYAMEIDPRFVQLSIERWQGFTGRTAERRHG